ncbi:hypothetical protein Drorol1_Dr00021109 [Drosera rotundifolia]
MGSSFPIAYNHTTCNIRNPILSKMLQVLMMQNSELPLVFLWIAITTIILIVIVSLRKARSKSESPRLPPGPRGLPVVGYLPFLRNDLHRQFTDLAKVYGPIYKLWLGRKLFVVINTPWLARQVLRDQDVTFANRSPTIGATIGTMGGQDIVFSDYNEGWRKRRKLFVTEMLSKASLEDCSHVLKQQVRQMVTNVRNNDIGKPIDVGLLASTTIMNTIMSLIWGDTLETIVGTKNIQAEYRVIVKKYLSLFAKPNISDFFPFLACFDLQGLERKMKLASQKCEDIIDIGIDHCIKTMKEEKNNGDKSKIRRRTNFLRILLELTNNDGSKSLALPEIKGILMNTLTGGADTITSTVEWAMAELLNNPIAMSKAQQELKSLIPKNDIVFDPSNLPHLAYLNAIIKETLRLHPPAPFLVPHCPNATTTLNGYIVPTDTTVFINLFAIQMNPTIWGEDAKQFVPERFLDGKASEVDWSGKWFQFIPFGSGRRICPGMVLAERVMVTVLATMLYWFKWRLPEGEVVDHGDEYGILIKKSKSLIAIPTPKFAGLEPH